MHYIARGTLAPVLRPEFFRQKSMISAFSNMRYAGFSFYFMNSETISTISWKAKKVIFLKKIFESTETDNIPELLPMLVVESPPSQPYFTQDNQVDEYTIKKKYLSPLECQNAFFKRNRL